MTETQPVVITGIGMEPPADAVENALIDRWRDGLGNAEAALKRKIGRRGVRYKDHATKLALAAAKTALEDAGLSIRPEERMHGDRFGVVAASNFGNLPTIIKVIDVIRSSGVDATSSMDLPNASSNVIAATLAIWFGLGAINLMACNGATSGADAIHLAANAIRVGRADRMLVAAAEIATPELARFVNGSAKVSFCDVSAAIVLETLGGARERGAHIYAALAGYEVAPPKQRLIPFCPIRESTREAVGLWLLPNDFLPSEEMGWRLPGQVPRVERLAAYLGETHGAEGVLQAVVAAGWLRDHPRSAALATCGGFAGDGAANIFYEGSAR